jgi:hypothetical protein
MTIDWTKPIETVYDGNPARILSQDYIYLGEKLTVVQYEDSSHSGIGYYHQNGEPVFGSPEIRNRKTQREGWINIYRDDRTGETIYETKEDAENSSIFKVATVKIEWEEP